MRLKTLLGDTGLTGIRDLSGRPMLLGTFLALSQVDPRLRRALAKMDLPKDREIDTSSMDALLESAATSVMNSLATAISGEGRGNRNIGQALDRLTQVVGRIEADQATQFEKQAGSLLGRGETVVRGWMQAGSEKLQLWADNRDAALDDKARDHVASAVRLAGQVLDASKGEAVTKTLLELNNRMPKPRFLSELATEMIGTTDENAGVNMLLNKARYVVSRVRQEFREELPVLLEERFTREMTEADWQALHLGVGRTDLAALPYSMRLANIRRMYADPAALDAEIARTEAAVDREGAFGGLSNQRLVSPADGRIRLDTDSPTGCSLKSLGDPELLLPGDTKRRRSAAGESSRIKAGA